MVFGIIIFAFLLIGAAALLLTHWMMRKRFGRGEYPTHPVADYFYDHYILQVGKIIHAIRTEELKNKFVNSYSKKRSKYEEDANL